MENAVFINIGPPLYGVRSRAVLFVWQLTKGVEYQLIEVTIYQLLSAINATVLIFTVINILY